VSTQSLFPSFAKFHRILVHSRGLEPPETDPLHPSTGLAMEHTPEQHIEHAEHAQHAAQNPFDRKVTMSIAIVAAILACVTMLGHRAHNATLLFQGEAIQLQTLAGVRHSEESNKWNYYQAQKFRSHMYQSNLEMLTELNSVLGKEKTSSRAVERWKKQVQKYESRFDAEKAKAEELEKEVKKLQAEAQSKLKESHHAHARSSRFDFGELLVELALVLCSISVLTKRAGFWYVGLVCCAGGTLVTITGVLDLFMALDH
jgi:hypothetical protein